ncbi:MAG: 2-isopropylmalate synthase [Candidatus Celerinatantimonas neptuna]|nr:MAG: 2-isopropylmalate synthase [Candidatus Celerinatantimonas neptuna]
MKMNKIFLQDNTIRDGFQQIGIKKDISTAISTIKILNTLNIDSVEIGMCSSNFDFNIIKKKINALDKNKKPVILTRLKDYDINKSIKLKSLFKNTKIKLLIPISDLHIEKKLKKTKEQFLEDIIYFQEVLHKHKILIDVCLEDATRADPIYLFKILDICNKYQNEFVTIADTVGFCTPEEYGELINTIYKKIIILKLVSIAITILVYLLQIQFQE